MKRASGWLPTAKVRAWLTAVTLLVAVSAASAGNEAAKPYVVLVLDTSESMLIPTGSGSTSCGTPDNRLNHAVCAINDIVQSYTDMVFALGRFRETSSGTGTPGSQVCDANDDQDGNAQATSSSSPSLIEPAGGGDACNTQGAVCGDCNAPAGTTKLCTVATQTTDCLSDVCNTSAETSCATAVDDDNDGTINDGCVANGAAETNCTDNLDNDADTFVNDGCPVKGQCGGNFGCTNADRNFEVLAPLVDGGNASAAKFVDGVCNSCNLAAGNPELWGVGSTFTPVSGTLLGAKRYWEGKQATDGTVLWPTTAAGYDPINRDPSNNVFLTATATATCSPNPTSCVNIAETTCSGASDDDTTKAGISVPDSFVNDGCPTVGGGPEAGAQCNNAVDDDGDSAVNDGCPAVCTGSNCCCASQCRPYITIMLTDGDETCTAFSNTLASAASLLDTRPRSDAVAISALTRNGTVATATTSVAHPFSLGDSIVVVVPNASTFSTTTTVLSVPSSTTITYNDVRASGTAANVSGATVAHVAGTKTYRVLTKPIGLGVAPGNANIEALAHAGGAPDLLGVNDGYYAADEAGVELAISDILADSVRTELCNGGDEDCDLAIDEAFPTLAQACSNGQVGTCLRSGTFECSSDGLGVQCNAPTVAPGVEGTVCDDMDNDCDSKIDEGLACCVPADEVCDNLDSDCDGVPDKTCRCSGGSNDSDRCSPTLNECPGGTCSCQDVTRACGSAPCTGTETCVGGAFTGCTAPAPTSESCDGLDNDCDGSCDGFELECSEQVAPCDMTTGACPAADSLGHAARNPIVENICHPGVRWCALSSTCSDNGDSGFTTCSGEVLPCGPDAPPGEGCDGCNDLDDDCDNVIDEDGACAQGSGSGSDSPELDKQSYYACGVSGSSSAQGPWYALLLIAWLCIRRRRRR